MTNTTKDFIQTASGPALVSVSGPRYGRQTFRVATLDWTAQVTQREHNARREYFAKTRVYGALDTFVPGFDAEETRLILAITDHSVKDKALASFQRAAVKTAKAALPGALEGLLEILAGSQRVTRGGTELAVKFSRTAGCSCPCSPGFVVDAQINVGGRTVDIWFDA